MSMCLMLTVPVSALLVMRRRADTTRSCMVQSTALAWIHFYSRSPGCTSDLVLALSR